MFSAGIWAFHFGYDNDAYPSMERASQLINNSGMGGCVFVGVGGGYVCMCGRVCVCACVCGLVLVCAWRGKCTGINGALKMVSRSAGIVMPFCQGDRVM